MATKEPTAEGEVPGVGPSDTYGAEQIKVLEGLDAVRKRPAMYIGSTGVEGLELEIWQEGQVFEQRYERGKSLAPLKVTGKTKKRGTKVTFKPDGQIFESLDFSFDVLAQRLRELAFLNKGLSISLTDERRE